MTDPAAENRATCPRRAPGGGGEEKYTLEYDELLLATGSTPFRPPIEGINRPGNFALRGIQDAFEVDDYINEKEKELFFSRKLRVVICGAGFIGVEMAEQLQKRGVQ